MKLLLRGRKGDGYRSVGFIRYVNIDYLEKITSLDYAKLLSRFDTKFMKKLTI